MPRKCFSLQKNLSEVVPLAVETPTARGLISR